MTKNDKMIRITNTNYIDYLNYLKNNGYISEFITLDQTSEIVTTNNLAKGSRGQVVDIRCPCGYKIVIPGREQLKEDAYALRVRFADKNSQEISPDTRIRIIKEKISCEITVIENVFYKDITITKYTKQQYPALKSDIEWYKFDQGIEIDGEQHLRIEVIDPDIEIDVSNVKLLLDIDLWERH